MPRIVKNKHLRASVQFFSRSYWDTLETNEMIHEFTLAGCPYFCWYKKVNELESGDENILNAKSVSAEVTYVLVISLQSCCTLWCQQLLRDWLVHGLLTEQAVLQCSFKGITRTFQNMHFHILYLKKTFWVFQVLLESQFPCTTS